MSLTRRSFSSLALSAPLLAQRKPDPIPAPTEEEMVTFREYVKFVTAPTTVTDKDGNFVTDIKPHEFRLFDNGKEQSLRVDVTFLPLDIVICVQANNTVEPVLDKIKQIGPLLETLVIGGNGEAAIIAFDHRINVLQDFTKDGDQIKAALQKIKPGSTTSAMNDAIVQASRMLKKRPADRRKVILMISETREKASEATRRQALLDLQFGNIVFYSININRLVTSLLTKPGVPRPDPVPTGARHLPAGALQTPETVASFTGRYGGNAVPLFVEIFRQGKSVFVDNELELYTKATGGTERSFLSYRDLERTVSEVGVELHSQYMLTYSPNNTEAGGFHEIRVEVNRKGLEVRTRPGYWLAAIPKP